MTVVFFIVLGVILVVGGVIVWFNTLPYQKRALFFKNMYFYMYRFLSSFFLTKSSALKIYHKISLLSVYRNDEIVMLTVWYFLISTAASGIVIIAGMILFNDIAAKLLTVLLAVVLRTVLVDKQLNKTHLNVMKETVRTLTSIEQEYMKSKSIPDALSNADTELLAKPIDEIHTILTGSESELRLQQFYASMPFRPLQTLAVVCYNLNLYGDTVDSKNTSGFVQVLTILKNDVNAEVEKITLLKSKLGIMEYLTLFAVFFIAPIEGYLTSTIPGLALMYNGMLGFILRTLVIAASIISYTVISRINSTSIVKDDDRGVWTEKLLSNKSWKRFVSGLAPKKEKKRAKLEFKLKKALSKMKFTHYYIKKVIFGGAVFVATLALIFLSINLGRDFARNTTAELSLVASEERSESEQNATRVMDEVYFESEGKMSDNELKTLVHRYLPSLSDMHVQDEMKRVRDKYSTWSGLYFHWYYVPVAFAFGIFGWFIPAIMIKIRTFLIKNEMEDDYMQLQTLVSILTYTELDTLSVLRQMEQHSTVHKEILLEAYHGFPSAPEMELERLKSKITFPGFKWFIDKLKLTISELPMNEAFSDLVSERENLMRLRHISMEASVSSKAVLGRILMILPMILLAVSEFIIPIGVLGVMEFTNALGMLR